MEKSYTERVPERLVHDAESLRLAQEYAKNTPRFPTEAEAYEYGLGCVGELDDLARKEGILGRIVSLSGPSVIVPFMQHDLDDGQVMVSVAKLTSDKLLSSYESTNGLFAGFHTAVQRYVETDSNGDDDSTTQSFEPVIVYIASTGRIVYTPLARVETFAYGNVSDTEIMFYDDMHTEGHYSDLDDIHDLGKYATDAETTTLSYFLKYYDEPLTADTIVGMCDSVEAINDQKDDTLTTKLVDTMLQMMSRRIEKDGTHFVLTANKAYGVRNFGLPTQNVIGIENPEDNNADIMGRLGSSRGYVVLPTFSFVINEDGTKEVLQDASSKRVYLVFDHYRHSDDPNVNEVMNVYVAVKDINFEIYDEGNEFVTE